MSRVRPSERHDHYLVFLRRKTIAVCNILLGDLTVGTEPFQAVNYTPHQMALLAGVNRRDRATFQETNSTLKTRMGSVCDVEEASVNAHECGRV